MSLFPNLVNHFSSLLNAPWTIFKDRVTFTKHSIHQLPAWNITPHKSKTILMLFLKKKVPKKLSWLSYSKNLQFWIWTKFTSLWFFSQNSWAQNGSHHIQELQNLSKERKRKLKQRRERCVKENRICCFFDWRLWSIRKWRGRGYLELSSRTQISGTEKRQGGGSVEWTMRRAGYLSWLVFVFLYMLLPTIWCRNCFEYLSGLLFFILWSYIWDGDVHVMMTMMMKRILSKCWRRWCWPIGCEESTY